jgi:hypothetical protein
MTPNTHYSWTETANGLAQQLHTDYAFIQRGVVPLRFVDDSMAPPRLVEDAPLVISVFGNDNYLRNDMTQKEVELVRQRIKETEGVEMAFGLSQDGQTWALLVATDGDRYKTRAGQILQKELLKLTLEEILARAWQHVTEAG